MQTFSSIFDLLARLCIWVSSMGRFRGPKSPFSIRSRFRIFFSRKRIWENEEATSVVCWELIGTFGNFWHFSGTFGPNDNPKAHPEELHLILVSVAYSCVYAEMEHFIFFRTAAAVKFKRSLSRWALKVCKKLFCKGIFLF